MDEPKFVQSAPASQATKMEAHEEKVRNPLGTIQGWGRQLKEGEVEDDADEFLTWLCRYPVERNHPRPTTGSIDVKKSGDAVVCVTTDVVSDVLQKLIVEGFLSMPVLSESSGGRFLGFIDMLDIVFFTLWNFGVWRSEQGQQGVAESKDAFEAFLAVDKFRMARVSDVIAREGWGVRNQSAQVYQSFSLFHVFESMARLSSHRVAITTPDLKVTGLITQSMVLSLLDQHMDRVGTMRLHSVAEMLPGLYHQLHAVHDTDTALQAFKDMVKYHVSGLAVLNSKGELVDTISVRDLRGMGAQANQWGNLWLSVSEFKAMCRAAFPLQTPAKPICVEKNDTLEAVIKAMDDGNIYRVFVVTVKDGQPIPTHVIAQRDVLRFLLYQCGLKSTSLDTTNLEAAAALS